MPISEAYQQAILNGALGDLLVAAGGSFKIKLLQNGVELSGNGYARSTIVEIPEASEIGDNGLCTVRLVSQDPLTASGGSITWNQLEIWDSTVASLIFPRFRTSGTIANGEAKKVTAVFGLPDQEELISQLDSIETDVATLQSTTTSLDTRLDTVEADIVDINAPTLDLPFLLPDGTGYSDAEGIDAITKLNAFTTGQEWHNKRCEIDIRAKRIPMAGTGKWSISRISGLSLATTGLGGTFSENQYGSASGTVYNTGGLASGFVWIDQDNLTGPMIESEGYGVNADNLLIQGKAHPEDPTTLVQDLHLRKEEGLRITGRDVAGTLPTGKNTGNLTVSLCVTGIRTVDTPYEDNADQLLIGRLRGHYCGTLFKSENKQTLGCRFDYVDQLHCPIGFDWVRGGKNWIGDHCIQAGSDVGVQITGIAGNIVGSFNNDYLLFDGTSSATALGLKIQPSSGYIAPTIVYGNVEVDYNISGARTSNPLMTMLGFYGDLIIQKGSGLFERFIHVTGGVENFHPKIFVYNCSFRLGSDMNSIRKLFTTTSSGRVEVVFVDNYEIYGGVDSANSGRRYTNYSNLIEIYNNNSTVTVL